MSEKKDYVIITDKECIKTFLSTLAQNENIKLYIDIGKQRKVKKE